MNSAILVPTILHVINNGGGVFHPHTDLHGKVYSLFDGDTCMGVTVGCVTVGCC